MALADQRDDRGAERPDELQPRHAAGRPDDTGGDRAEGRHRHQYDGMLDEPAVQADPEPMREMSLIVPDRRPSDELTIVQATSTGRRVMFGK